MEGEKDTLPPFPAASSFLGTTLPESGGGRNVPFSLSLNRWEGTVRGGESKRGHSGRGGKSDKITITYGWAWPQRIQWCTIFRKRPHVVQ